MLEYVVLQLCQLFILKVWFLWGWRENKIYKAHSPGLILNFIHLNIWFILIYLADICVQSDFNCMHGTLSLLSSRATILVELEKDGNTDHLNFVPGDHVGIFPGNTPELVCGILKHLSNAPPINQSLRLEFLSDSYPGTEPCNPIT